MTKDVTTNQAILNLSIIALVSLVAIVGILALVLNAASSGVEVAPTVEQASVIQESPVPNGNLVGDVKRGIIKGEPVER